MADRFRILSQTLPSDTNETTAYSVPVSSDTVVGSVTVAPRSVFLISQVVVTSVIVCNLDSSAHTFRLRLKSGAESTASCTTVSGDATVTTASTAGLYYGLPVSGTGVTAGSTIAAINSSTSFELSANATATGSPTLTFAADNNKEFLFYDTSVAANATQVLALGLVLEAGNLIKVRSSDANDLAFTIMGIEVT